MDPFPDASIGQLTSGDLEIGDITFGVSGARGASEFKQEPLCDLLGGTGAVTTTGTAGDASDAAGMAGADGGQGDDSSATAASVFDAATFEQDAMAEIPMQLTEVESVDTGPGGGCTTPPKQPALPSTGAITGGSMPVDAKYGPPPQPGQRADRAAWTMEEDVNLRILVDRHGLQQWSTIALDLDGRTGKQCRERWTSKVRVPPPRHARPARRRVPTPLAAARCANRRSRDPRAARPERPPGAVVQARRREADLLAGQVRRTMEQDLSIAAWTVGGRRAAAVGDSFADQDVQFWAAAGAGQRQAGAQPGDLAPAASPAATDILPGARVACHPR